MHLAILALLPMLAVPEGAGLRGVVLDATGAPIAAAIVEVRESGGVFRAEATTDTSGTFDLARVPRLPLQLEVRAPRFQTLRRAISPDAWPASPLRLTLEEEVTVGGELDRVAVDPEPNRDAVVFNRELLDALPVLNQDLVAAASLWLNEGLTGAGGSRSRPCRTARSTADRKNRPHIALPPGLDVSSQLPSWDSYVHFGSQRLRRPAPLLSNDELRIEVSG